MLQNDSCVTVQSVTLTKARIRNLQSSTAGTAVQACTAVLKYLGTMQHQLFAKFSTGIVVFAVPRSIGNATERWVPYQLFEAVLVPDRLVRFELLHILYTDFVLIVSSENTYPFQ